ncbi:hypothetical protein AFK65_04465 [Cronobacter universalis NCTC 9529]|uniref:Uncharacterized protein n=1 Tax=Cronobacter universalis NCTC 9529 TaxID=1074000 RepID=A0AAC8VN82_9ENTR|nr:hypothetical protein [Cronobacter universalis]ALB53952.1 hypothetical protein AFK65_04465 [Cronobacter universalis NCTC 9529]
MVRHDQTDLEYVGSRAAGQADKTYSLCGFIVCYPLLQVAAFRDLRHRKRGLMKQSLIPLAK